MTADVFAKPLNSFGEDKTVKLVRSSLTPIMNQMLAEQVIPEKAADSAPFVDLGAQLTPVLPMPGVNNVWYSEYQNGTIYWAAGGKGAFILSKEIRDKWYSLGGPSGFLGMPLIAYKKGHASGSEVDFEGGLI